VVNTPGSPKAAIESLAAIEPTLAHALETLAGPFDHGAAGAGHAARRDLSHPEGANPPHVDAGGNEEAWVPIPDDNDEWRDLPGGRSS
jgi:hypothetical protein